MADDAKTLARLAARLNTGALPRLVLMTDDARLPDPCGAAARLPRGSLVVLRTASRARRLGLAAALARIARARGLYLAIADDPALAAAMGADGMHFPEAKLDKLAHWRARRPRLLFTAAAHSLRAALKAAACGADAIFVSPIFATASHPGRETLGPLRLRALARQLRVPVYALGGIDARSARRLAGARLAGFAAIGALDVKPQAQEGRR